MEKIKREDWIALADRQPEDYLICLVTDGRDVAVATPDHKLRGSPLWWDVIGVTGYEWEFDMDVTHWMALSVELPTAPD